MVMLLLHTHAIAITIIICTAIACLRCVVRESE